MNTIKIDRVNKKISVPIPLTTTTGKVRIKKRNSIYDYGQSFATRKERFNLKNYVEWQIGYDIETNSKNINLTTLRDITFIAYNKKEKSLYELSEYLFYLIDLKIISIIKLKELNEFIKKLNKEFLISKQPHCEIKRTHPHLEKINELDFEILKIEYPQLIHRFKNYEIITEITIREKQKAVGIQPMLYLCFPITELKSDIPLIGRCANKNEFAFFEISKDNSFIILEIVKIFGMLSSSHQQDIIKILELIINKTSI